jgi:hypothetical protein
VVAKRSNHDKIDENYPNEVFMNYYAHGGQAHGIRELASELPKHGRGGDTIVAHINPQEAQMLKALGGSGTINPTTGLPEFIGGLGALNPFNKGSVVGKAIAQIPGVKETQNLATQVFQPVEKAVVQPVSQGLVQLDKAVGKAIPGGWGTVAQVAGSFMGLPTPVMVGLGALNGSGVMHPGRKFNMQGALMGGAMAYGMSELGEYARGANLDAGVSAPNVPTPNVTMDPIVPPDIGPPNPTATTPTINSTPSLSEIADIRATQPNVFERAYNSVSSPIEGGIQSLKETANAAVTPSTYTDALSRGMDNASQTGSGIGDLITDNKAATAQADALVKSGAITKPINAGIATLGGTMGLMQAEDLHNYNKEANAANNKAKADYNAQLAAITDSQRYAEDVMRRNPYKFAEGGMMPRFLSGGGDGLSDDIDAMIGSKQPAKLADGEFVVSADVVSGLGGGSSKAGARKLYEMMDRVRQQAHGTKKQVRKVSNTALPA